MIAPGEHERSPAPTHKGWTHGVWVYSIDNVARAAKKAGAVAVVVCPHTCRPLKFLTAKEMRRWDTTKDPR